MRTAYFRHRNNGDADQRIDIETQTRLGLAGGGGGPLDPSPRSTRASDSVTGGSDVPPPLSSNHRARGGGGGPPGDPDLVVSTPRGHQQTASTASVMKTNGGRGDTSPRLNNNGGVLSGRGREATSPKSGRSHGHKGGPAADPPVPDDRFGRSYPSPPQEEYTEEGFMDEEYIDEEEEEYMEPENVDELAPAATTVYPGGDRFATDRTTGFAEQWDHQRPLPAVQTGRPITVGPAYRDMYSTHPPPHQRRFQHHHQRPSLSARYSDHYASHTTTGDYQQADEVMEEEEVVVDYVRPDFQLDHPHYHLY